MCNYSSHESEGKLDKNVAMSSGSYFKSVFNFKFLWARLNIEIMILYDSGFRLNFCHKKTLNYRREKDKDCNDIDV